MTGVSYNPFGLSGKRVLVTGASSGIGKSIAVECSRLGAQVVLTGRNEDRLKCTLSELDGDGHSMVSADLTDADQQVALVERVGLLDGVVLCPGINIPCPLKMATRKKFNKLFETNFFSLAELMRLLLKGRNIAQGASIVTMSSVTASSDIQAGAGIYGTTKAALTAWTKYLARELADKGIRANAVCPGMVDTPLIHDDNLDLDRERSRYPLGRLGYPHEVAWAVIYLLSDAAKWVTGTEMVIDGGLTL